VSVNEEQWKWRVGWDGKKGKKGVASGGFAEGVDGCDVQATEVDRQC
jgi:hypothetical protein